MSSAVSVVSAVRQWMSWALDLRSPSLRSPAWPRVWGTGVQVSGFSFHSRLHTALPGSVTGLPAGLQQAGKGRLPGSKGLVSAFGAAATPCSCG